MTTTHNRSSDNGAGADRPTAEAVDPTTAHGRAAEPTEDATPQVLVDRPNPDPAPRLTAATARAAQRRPIIPAWLRSRREATAAARWVIGHYTHTIVYHTTRAPTYAGRLLLRAPLGAGRLLARTARWAADLEGLPVRLAAVRREDAESYLKLSRQRDARVRWRTLVGIAATIAAAAAAVALLAAPEALRWTALAGLLVLLGVLGSPADRPLLDTAVVVPRVARLTSDVVIRALGALGIAEINKALGKGGGIHFVAPIARDGGTGWRADVDLPYGVTVTDIVERRDRLASGLRRPLGCVWPESARGQHPGRLVLFVGDEDMNTAPQPAWPLKRTGHADLFKPIPFGTDQRGRLVAITLMFANMLIGAMPRVGKTFSVKPLLLAAGLDPLVRALVFELKGTGDLSFAERFAHTYASGLDDDTMYRCLLTLREVKQDLIRRSQTIAGLPKDICPENKVTPALAAKPSLGLEPVGIFIDECQNLFAHPVYGDEAGELCEFIIRLGPAMGVFLVLATQRPDKDSLPTGISANVGIRFCLRVMGQTENDMILGTSAYKNGIRATTFTADDLGIGYLLGASVDPQTVKTFPIDAPGADHIAERARTIRIAAGRLSGYAAGQTSDRADLPGFNLLDDIAAVVPADEGKVWSETVVARLAELRPETYAGWAPEQLAIVLAPLGIDTIQISRRRGGGQLNRRGIDRADIARAIAERTRNRPAE